MISLGPESGADHQMSWHIIILHAKLATKCRNPPVQTHPVIRVIRVHQIAWNPIVMTNSLLLNRAIYSGFTNWKGFCIVMLVYQWVPFQSPKNHTPGIGHYWVYIGVPGLGLIVSFCDSPGSLCTSQCVGAAPSEWVWYEDPWVVFAIPYAMNLAKSHWFMKHVGASADFTAILGW